MHDLQYNGGKQVHAATGLIAACVHKSALSSSQPTGQSTMYLYVSNHFLSTISACEDGNKPKHWGIENNILQTERNTKQHNIHSLCKHLPIKYS